MFAAQYHTRNTHIRRSPAADRLEVIGRQRSTDWRSSVASGRPSTLEVIGRQLSTVDSEGHWSPKSTHRARPLAFCSVVGSEFSKVDYTALTSCPNNFTLIYDNAILRRDVDCDVSSCFHRPGVKTLRQITKKLYKSVGTFLLTAMYPGNKQASTYAQSPYTSQARTASTALMAYLDSRLLAECRWRSQRRHYNPSDRRWRYRRWCGWCRTYWCRCYWR